MAKNTNAAGDSYTERELADPVPPVVITRATLAGEKAWTEKAGTDSSEFSKKAGDSQTNKPTGHPSNAPTMESPSSQPLTESDSALTTTSGGPEGEVLVQEDVEPYDQWSYSDLQAECKARGLTATGKSDDLIARLEQWDEDNPDA